MATPGRLLHIISETGLSLKAVEYVVFDEADRLFELGLKEQILEILSKIPSSRQTLLVSATLPSVCISTLFMFLDACRICPSWFK